MVDLCEEWGDDQRMDFVFAPLKDKEANPESWAAKVAFWTCLVCKWCQHTQTCVLDEEILRQAFERKGRSPHCLNQVLTQSLASGILCSVPRFKERLRPKARVSWGQWAAGWGKTIQASLVGEAFTPGNKYVLPEQAESLLANLRQRILRSAKEKSTVRRSNQAWYLKEAELNQIVEAKDRYLLEFLLDKGSIATSDVASVKIYKIVEVDRVVDFDELDEAIVSLNNTIECLEKEITEGENSIKNIDGKIKENVKSGSRISAKSLLMKKKQLEKRLLNKVKQKANAEELLDEIQGAESNKSVIDSFKSGLSALKESMADVSKDSIEETMFDFNDTVRMSVEASDALSMGTVVDYGDVCVDESDLEEELRKLVTDDEIFEAFKANDSEEAELLKALDNLEIEVSPPKPKKAASKISTMA